MPVECSDCALGLAVFCFLKFEGKDIENIELDVSREHSYAPSTPKPTLNPGSTLEAHLSFISAKA